MIPPPKLIIAPGGRNAVAGIIARLLGPDARVVHLPDGSPVLAGADGHISISHSRSFAAVAFSDHWRIGVDIEQPRPQQLQRIAARFLSPADMLTWTGDLLTAWTIKEAVYKAAGTPGLPLGAIDISRPGRASIPDGRQFHITSQATADYSVTVARPLDPAEAEIDALDLIIDKNPRNADALFRRGRLRMKIAEFGPALSDFNRAAELNPGGPAETAAQAARAILEFHIPANP